LCCLKVFLSSNTYFSQNAQTNTKEQSEEKKKLNIQNDPKRKILEQKIPEKTVRKPNPDGQISKRSALSVILEQESSTREKPESGPGSKKTKGTDVISVNYIILDGLTSSWREFLALHEVAVKVNLASDILAAAPQEMFSDLHTPTGHRSPW
jgi:hypothetical protein